MASSARPSGRARIETTAACLPVRSPWVAPVLRDGRGLKQNIDDASSLADPVAPVLRDGRGLKPRWPALPPWFPRSARPSGRARIETDLAGADQPHHQRSARPSGRARIETDLSSPTVALLVVAPVLRDGRGLKHREAAAIDDDPGVAPVLRDGRGLKPILRRPHQLRAFVAPVLRDGRGLKPILRRPHQLRAFVAPVLRDGRGLKL